MTAATRYPTPQSAPVAPADALVAHAEALKGANRLPEAEAALRDAITIAPDNLAAYRALALLQANDYRDLEAFATCATMLSRAGRPDAETMRLAAELLLFLHIRHATLVARQAEPVRLDFRAIGVPDVAPMVLAPEFLKRSQALAQAAAALAPHDAIALATLAECELRAGFETAARTNAERAVACEGTAGTLLMRALATFADHHEERALELLRQPQLTELVPALGAGRQGVYRVDGALAPSTVAADGARRDWRIPYRVHHEGREYDRSVTVRTGSSEVRVLRQARVVGDLFFAIDRHDRAYIHGVVDEPDVQFGIPRCHDIPTVLSHGRNCVLWSSTDQRILLHSPTAERVRGGRAVLLATNFAANYYHWIADCLGRLAAAPELLTDPDVRFVIPAPLQPFQVETLGWLGVSLDRVVQVAPDEVAEFDELTLIQHRKDGGCTDASTWQWLRGHLTLPALGDAPTPTRRLYVRRSSAAAMRRLANEAEVEGVCREYGFESVETGRMTVVEQRDLFSQAAVVVAPVGASLTNLVFAPSGARTIQFGQRGYIVPCYNALADALEHSVRYVLGTEQQSRFVYPHWDYSVDTVTLRQALDAELSQAARPPAAPADCS
ncbi:MAG: glycosyltransferase family 61 protein [Gemmatimonadaceae bacterium]|nr:glycosyltransferase family 61 protein [Gemmatimonadaceae bacterium]